MLFDLHGSIFEWFRRKFMDFSTNRFFASQKNFFQLHDSPLLDHTMADSKTVDEEIIKYQLQFGSNGFCTGPQYQGFLQMHIAARLGDMDFLVQELDLGFDVNIKTENKYSWTNLHYAACYNKPAA